jgi:hypothetical protein
MPASNDPTRKIAKALRRHVYAAMSMSCSTCPATRASGTRLKRLARTGPGRLFLYVGLPASLLPALILGTRR